VVALMHERTRFNMGFGIDENTALIYLGSKDMVKIAGAGGVTIINTQDARFSYVKELPCIENLLVSYLGEGDTYDIKTGIVTPAEGKKPTRGNEYYNISNPGQAGVLSANSTAFSNLATISLIDNKGAEVVKNISLSDQESGFMVTLYKTPVSEGFYTDKPDDEDHYTVINLRMDIVPVQVTISILK
jgi:cyanophycinase